MGAPIVHFEIGCRDNEKTRHPETEVPGQGAFAWLKDLDGNTIGLWKSASETRP